MRKEGRMSGMYRERSELGNGRRKEEMMEGFREKRNE